MKPDFIDDSANSFGLVLIGCVIFGLLILAGIVIGLLYLFGVL
jgi:hypothetical protein